VNDACLAIAPVSRKVPRNAISLAPGGPPARLASPEPAEPEPAEPEPPVAPREPIGRQDPPAAALDAALDSLGRAHHRPYSRA
jgi:hypothetical protein